jgi:hypothetical protein
MEVDGLIMLGMAIFAAWCGWEGIAAMWAQWREAGGSAPEQVDPEPECASAAEFLRVQVASLAPLPRRRRRG